MRYQLQQQGLPVDDAPDDDVARETYNFPPGAFGLVYRADIPDRGVQQEAREAPETQTQDPGHEVDGNANEEADSPDHPPHSSQTKNGEYKYHLKAMKWGLVPFWTKRSPDYGSVMRTINCRDDSLIENKGMWTTMKQRKRCIVVAQGFYEWLKKGPGGKEKIPHFVKRKDGQLMCFAGLWDCVKYEDSDEKLYTYTIITTDSNKQLSFLHDRMPVMLDAGSEKMKTWLDPDRNKWSKELQSLLRPYDGELECYQVSKEVGKVGNNSPDFIVPIDSKDNKKNIANFFGNTQKANASLNKRAAKKEEEVKVEHEEQETRPTKDHEGTEDNAPLPDPPTSGEVGEAKAGSTRKHEDEEGVKSPKAMKLESSPSKHQLPSPKSARKTRSATSNADVALKKSPVKSDGTQRITAFFGK